MLARGKPEIDREVEKARLLIRQGGYFVNCDHHIPPDVSSGRTKPQERMEK